MKNLQNLNISSWIFNILFISVFSACGQKFGKGEVSSSSGNSSNSSNQNGVITLASLSGDSAVDIVDDVDTVSGGVPLTSTSGDTYRNLSSAGASFSSSTSSTTYLKRIPLMNVVWLSYRVSERNRIAFIVDKNEVACGLVPNSLKLYYKNLNSNDVRVRLVATAQSNAVCPMIYHMNPQVYIYRMSDTFRNKNLVFNQYLRNSTSGVLEPKTTYTRLNWSGTNLVNPVVGVDKFHTKTVNFDHRSQWGNPFGVRSIMAALSPHDTYYSSAGRILFSEIMVSGLASSECPNSTVRCEGGQGNALITIRPKYFDSATDAVFQAQGFAAQSYIVDDDGVLSGDNYSE